MGGWLGESCRRGLGLGLGNEEGDMATSPLSAGPFPVRATQPMAISLADQVMIGVDAFRFGTATDTDSIEWDYVLLFSEISELEYKATGGRVSGTLQDGTELAFRIDQVLAGEEAMRAVEALFDPEAGLDVEFGDGTDPGDGRPVEWPESVEAAFADAAGCDAEPQVRRFAQLTANAGLDTDRFKNQRRLVARRPGTKETAFELYWLPKSRFNMGVYRTGAFGAGESKALGTLPKTKKMSAMDAAGIGRYLDALEVFLAAHPVEEATGGRIRVRASGDSTPESSTQPLVPTAPAVSDEGLTAALQALTGAFEDAVERDCEPQVERFARLTLTAGLEIEWVSPMHQFAAIWPGTEERVFTMLWYSRSRFSVSVAHVDAFGVFGEDGYRALTALPKTKTVRKMDIVETDRFLDALEVFLAAHPLKESPDHSKAGEIVDASQEPTPRRLLVRTTQILSDDELAEAMRSLEKRFDKAAEFGVEPQARRFAELTAAADLDVRWNGRGLDAVWRRTRSVLFYLNWDYRGWAKVGYGTHRETVGDGMAVVVNADEVDWDINWRAAQANASPKMGYTRKMDAAEINHITDLYLDWLQEYLATHALPSREDEAIHQKERRLSNRSSRAVTLAFLTPIWVILSVFLLLLLPGQISFNEPVGLVMQGLLFSVVPVLAVVMGLKARRDLREDDSTRSRSRRSDIRTAWVAIILGTLITVGFVAGYGIAVMKQLTGNS